MTPSLLWLGGYEEATGLADEIRGFLRALEGRGHEPAVRSFIKPRQHVDLSPADRRMLQAQSARKTKFPLVAVHHYITNPRQVDVQGAVNVARVMFETDRLPAVWLSLLLQRDEIWVPCEHNAEAFRRGGVPESKLRVLGETLDFNLFSPGAEPYDFELEEDRFVFLSNFDFGDRKGWDRLIAAWAEAFTADDGVCLVLKTGSYTHGPEYAADRISQYVNDRYGAGKIDRMAPIQIVSAMLPAQQIPSLYAAADAYVLASRGEGWGRPYMEAMAMGLPTIGSRWSGNLDFMNDGNSWLVDGKLVPVPEGAELFPTQITQGHNWFEPDVDALAAAMREVATNSEAVRARAAGARTELIERFGPDAIVDRIEELARGALERRSRPFACAIRGTFGSNASLAVVNDGIAGALDRQGSNVAYRGTHDEMLVDELPGVTHSWPPNFEPATIGPTVVILPWEYGAPPKEWVEEVRARADRVWVPSAYVRDGYIEAGMPPGVVEVVPNGVDLELFTPDGPRYELPSQAGCSFLFVGGSIWRKGMDLLLEAWADAFGPDDDVQLVIKDFGVGSHYKGQTAGDRVMEFAERDDVAPIVYLDHDMTPDELASLYRACDVFVTSYRGEGFCLPALEAMASGLPVVHNGVGPTSEFVPEDGGWAVPAERAPLREGARLPDLVSPGYVHEVDHDRLVEALRDAAAAPEERRVRGLAAHARAQDYHWDTIGAIAKQSLDTLAEEGLPLAREIAPAELEHRGSYVLFAPDWNDETSWTPALENWVSAVNADDPVTLALYLPLGADSSAVAARVMACLAATGVAEDRLPDLALCEPDSAGLPNLVAAAAAVLVPEAGSAGPELTRRARCVLVATAGDIESFAGGIRGIQDVDLAGLGH